MLMRGAAAVAADGPANLPPIQVAISETVVIVAYWWS